MCRYLCVSVLVPAASSELMVVGEWRSVVEQLGFVVGVGCVGW